MLGKSEWKNRSSQPTPRVAKLLAPEPLIPFAEPQEQIPLIRHLFIIIFNPCPMLASCLLMDILLYSILPRTWSFMSLLLFSTQLGVMT